MSVFNQIKDTLSGRQVLTHFLGPPRGRAWVCPWHEDRHPSLSAKGPVIRCWAGCFQGDVFSFIEKYLSVSPREALQALADLAGISLPRPAKRRRMRPLLISESLRAVRRETVADLEEIWRLATGAAAEAWRRAWATAKEAGGEAPATWEAVALASNLDRHLEILRMELEAMKGDERNRGPAG